MYGIAYTAITIDKANTMSSKGLVALLFVVLPIFLYDGWLNYLLVV